MDDKTTQETTTTEVPVTEIIAQPDADAPDMPLEGSSVDVDVTSGMDVIPAAGAAIEGKIQTLELLSGLSQNVIYLMGLSFILGSLFTVFVLLVLDFMRRNNTESK